ncbi:adenine phosphoribosyltransferase [Coriobacterium glomerans PW2]|uniref:Adenine phosphoribosyltransferase n=1 Tax=Coriobacterium glomerans (strain ATCC 49209 / DSM 20642 / JCM 10262 / PW2) TaxID=700015 RepID=F2N7W1_CORGP|nr:adenine phosphoribosyltransferase [Coriobacterium glomerans]AEB07070.1 adenine phosphoribosyltransferase [Coriobacterium glomerans PW2]
MSTFDFSAYIADIPDYPEPGVLFKDITPLFADAVAMRATIATIAEHFQGQGVTKVIGPEARGFMVGVPVALEVGAGFVPARKPGKLPRETISVSYDLEYGTDTLQIHADALTAEDRVLIIDDLVATGGTLAATGELVQTTGAHLIGYGCILELGFLHPRDALAKVGEHELFSLVKVD